MVVEEYRGFSNKYADENIQYIKDNLNEVISRLIKNIDYNDRVCMSKGEKDGKDSFIYNFRSLVTHIINDKIKKNIEISWKDAITLSSILDISNGSYNEILLNKEINNLLICTDSKSEKERAVHNNYLINIMIPLDKETKPLYDVELYDESKYYHAIIEGISVFRVVKNPKFESDAGYRFPVTLWLKDGGVQNLWITGEFEQPIDNLPKSERNLHLFVRNYISNLHSLMNHPDVTIIKKEYFNNKKRQERGQTTIPIKHFINLTGKLKRYMNEVSEQNEKAWELGHRFWVRGHWMEFKHERYKNKQGQKTWVLPYIKGKGELVKKDYYVGEKEQCWEHEKQMIKVVQELYPQNKIEKHNRTVLDGLEIDCYIPELKLGFEYNGLQHYEHVEYFHKTKEDFEAQKDRDVEKLKRAEEKGIKIITIRYDEAVTKEVIEAKLP